VDVDAELKGNAEWKRVRPGVSPDITRRHFPASPGPRRPSTTSCSCSWRGATRSGASNGAVTVRRTRPAGSTVLGEATAPRDQPEGRTYRLPRALRADPQAHGAR
jgi:hypothetical protein